VWRHHEANEPRCAQIEASQEKLHTCGEGIGAHKKAVLVMVPAQSMSIFFHAECYEVWDAERLALPEKNGDGAAHDLTRRVGHVPNVSV
jgi:hypothetical protein